MKIRYPRCTLLLHLLAGLAASTQAGLAADSKPPRNLEQGLIGYWKLAGDCQDYSQYRNHGRNHGVVFEKDGRGLAAKFDGLGAYIEVPDKAVLNPGNGDFSISAWVKCEAGVLAPPGDLVSKFDSVQRNGLNFRISASEPGYSSVSDVRNLEFGIDNAVEGEWVDCGRPSFDNTLISTLVVYRGQLYTGIADATDPSRACHLYRYAGGTNWVDCGRVGNDLKTPSVYSIIVHKDQLYVGTGVWDWEKVWRGNSGPNHVYRYEGGTNWHDCGQFGSGYRVLSLASLGGNLYAADDKGFQFRYDGDNAWTPCGDVNKDEVHKDKKIFSTMAYRGQLFGGSSVKVLRFGGGETWDAIAQFDPKIINQIHTLEVWQGNLFAGTWPEGKVVKYLADNDWEDCGNTGIDTVNQKINEVNELTAYNGKLYAGVLPKGEVWRYEEGKKWSLVRQVVQNPGWDVKKLVTWNRVPCMTVFQGKFYAGSSTCHGRAEATPATDAGKVFSWEAGKCVTYDEDLGTNWRHVVAVKKAQGLELYVDGKLVANSGPLDPKQFTLANQNPLLIGFGARNYFAGHMNELRIYNRALKTEEISYLHDKPVLNLPK